MGSFPNHPGLFNSPSLPPHGGRKGRPPNCLHGVQCPEGVGAGALGLVLPQHFVQLVLGWWWGGVGGGVRWGGGLVGLGVEWGGAENDF